jgi:UDP-glucose 4-epimerase
MILVTGGLGYIGSHTVVELLENNYEVVIIDNLSNSSKDVIDSIKNITKKDVVFYEGDVCDLDLLEKIFSSEKIDAVMHFAGYKAVGESVKKPIMYYENNIVSTLHLCQKMIEHNCFKFIFSSSATVYGDPEVLPITEDCKVGGTTNPYGTTKLMQEKILSDINIANPQFTVMILRYFNPIGAHKSGLIGEKPNGIPNNLMPYICKVAVGDLECLNIWGNDYPTVDGTGVRDYIHVVDLARGHVCALNKIINDNGLFIYNLGTGNGFSVLQLVNTFSKVNNIDVNYKIVSRRAGDVATCYADTSKAKNELGFETKKTIEDMCRDAYNYALKNKN